MTDDETIGRQLKALHCPRDLRLWASAAQRRDPTSTLCAWMRLSIVSAFTDASNGLMFTATSSDSWNIIEGSSNTNQEVGTGDRQPCVDELQIHLLAASGDGSKSRFLFPVQDQIGHRWSRWGHRVGRCCCGLPGWRRTIQEIRDSPAQKWVQISPEWGF